EGLLDGLLGNLVEHHPTVAGFITADGLAQVPGNRLPLAVQVRCQIDGVGFPGQTTQFVDDLFLAGQYLVAGLPAVLGVNAHAVDQLHLCLGRLVDVRSRLGTLGFALGLAAATGGQIADMSDARLHHKVIAKILVDRLRLGWCLHNVQCFSHGYWCSSINECGGPRRRSRRPADERQVRRARAYTSSLIKVKRGDDSPSTSTSSVNIPTGRTQRSKSP